MKKIIFAIILCCAVACSLAGVSCSYARGLGDDREARQDSGISGEDGQDDTVQNPSDDDNPNDVPANPQDVNEGAGPIKDDEGGM